jgi:hypothetical protein
MSDHQDVDQQSAAGLRDVARMLLDGIEEVDDREQKRRLARHAFAVLQEAIELQLGTDEGDPTPLETSLEIARRCIC